MSLGRRRETEWRIEATGPNGVFPRRLSASASPRFSRSPDCTPVTLTPLRERLTHYSSLPLPLFPSSSYHRPSFLWGPSFLPFLSLQFSSIESWLQRSVILGSFFSVDFRLYTFLGVRPGCSPPFLPYSPGLPTSTRGPIFHRPFCCAKIIDEILDIHSESVPDTVRTRPFD
jgi:hypothetical protein